MCESYDAVTLFHNLACILTVNGILLNECFRFNSGHSCFKDGILNDYQKRLNGGKTGGPI